MTSVAASNKTIQQVLEILSDEVDSTTLDRIVRRLAVETTGNKSYVDSVASLHYAVFGHLPGRMPGDRHRE